MSVITDYASLQAAIGDFLNRSDLTAVIPQFIAFAEAQFQRELRTRQMLERAVATINSQYTLLPTDYLENRYIQINDTVPYRLQHCTAQEMQDLRLGSSDIADKPRKYTIVGVEIEVYPSPDTAYIAEIGYIQQIPPLSDSNTTNWLLTAHPDLYLYTSLVHSAPYLRDDQRISMWQSAHDIILGAIKEQEDRARYSEGPLKVKLNAIGSDTVWPGQWPMRNW